MFRILHRPLMEYRQRFLPWPPETCRSPQGFPKEPPWEKDVYPPWMPSESLQGSVHREIPGSVADPQVKPHMEIFLLYLKQIFWFVGPLSGLLWVRIQVSCNDQNSRIRNSIMVNTPYICFWKGIVVKFLLCHLMIPKFVDV